jgi:hypothetical protein
MTLLTCLRRLKQSYRSKCRKFLYTPCETSLKRVRKAYLLTYSLTPCSRVPLEKPTDLQLVKKFPAFYVTRRFIAAFKSARHLSLSWASLIQSIPPHPTSWRSILILSSHLRLGLPSGLFLSGFPTKTLCKRHIQYIFLEQLVFCPLKYSGSYKFMKLLH